jgi:hypothetical protein
MVLNFIRFRKTTKDPTADVLVDTRREGVVNPITDRMRLSRGQSMRTVWRFILYTAPANIHFQYV